LEAFTKFVADLPADIGMAFILVQHLDPTHPSMMVELLSSHTTMAVVQATDGMPVVAGHLYVIPPGSYLFVEGQVLRLTPPRTHRGARLPFDFLLHSLAAAFGRHAVCVILSGTGADGSAGLLTVRERDGFVIAQDPKEAAYDGMPRNAILTGCVDLVLPIAEIASALVRHRAKIDEHDDPANAGETPSSKDCLPAIVELLRTGTAHDFTMYKSGTVQRRIERRMGLMETADMGRYLEILKVDPHELDVLAKDLLINVTRFFRDSNVFDIVKDAVIPRLIADRPSDQTLRIWTAGCSSGEETYSLAMIAHERIAAAGLQIKLQIFASDVDADAVAFAREGLYPITIEADVTPERLARFFSKEDHGYRVLPDLRANVVFAIQDLLVDPPFSRLDLVSCRNVLIYLRPDAQEKLISLFHFALRDHGILLLGSAETATKIEGRFEVVSKQWRIYRRIGHTRHTKLDPSVQLRETVLPRAASGTGRMPSRQTDLSELGRRMVLETYAPAAMLINHAHDCLFSLGPTDRYLRVPTGRPTHDILAMARPGLRTRLRSALEQAIREKKRIVSSGGQFVRDGQRISFNIEVQPVSSGGEELLLVCFVDSPAPGIAGMQPLQLPGDTSTAARVVTLEQELQATRSELQGAVHDLELANEEQKAINEEASSVNEEFQSTNEELLTSKEELQSLNEELTALNSQLQETLERQRKTADDLQNVLFSTDVATLFLDADLKIRFFTPATKSLFAVIAGDIGRPLADLHSLAADAMLTADSRAVLEGSAPLEREIEAPEKSWFRRRISSYRSHDGKVEGVVITFNDITRRREAAGALEVAVRQADLANLAKTRFLAAASHDFRQPLQTLALLQGMLAKIVEGDRARTLVARLDDTLGTMAGMLNALLDINQIDAGIIRPNLTAIPMATFLAGLRDAFMDHAQVRGLELRVVSCGLSITSDLHLLEQILRNLIANALKYSEHGKVLIGCRRHGDKLRIEVWDTGIGIPQVEIATIFEEYRQLDNPARERARGLGLGLSIVKRLAALLDHSLAVRSTPGKGSVFSVEVPVAAREVSPVRPQAVAAEAPRRAAQRTQALGKILVVDDDPEIRDLLALHLRDEGHHVLTASNGMLALERIMTMAIRPDMAFVDYNLPGGLNGADFAGKLRERLGWAIPIVVLTGDVSTETLRTVAAQGCEQLNKPVRLAELSRLVERLLSESEPQAAAAEQIDARAQITTIYVIDDDPDVREIITAVLKAETYTVMAFSSAEAFLEAGHTAQDACPLVDAKLPGMGGLDLLRQLTASSKRVPSIMITGQSDVSMAVAAMQAGASDFIEKPVGRVELLDSVARALEHARNLTKRPAWQDAAIARLAGLTSRQREIMHLVLAGHPSKNIAADLAISQRTVENHRAAIMRKAGVSSMPALARLAVAAAGDDEAPPPNRTAA
jgi:two-component system CheB/CheR fusion protein